MNVCFLYSNIDVQKLDINLKKKSKKNEEENFTKGKQEIPPQLSSLTNSSPYVFDSSGSSKLHIIFNIYILNKFNMLKVYKPHEFDHLSNTRT